MRSSDLLSQSDSVSVGQCYQTQTRRVQRGCNRFCIAWMGLDTFTAKKVIPIIPELE